MEENDMTNIDGTNFLNEFRKHDPEEGIAGFLNQKNFLTDHSTEFIAHILCQCGSLAGLWWDGRGLFSVCKECGGFRKID